MDERGFRRAAQSAAADRAKADAAAKKSGTATPRVRRSRTVYAATTSSLHRLRRGIVSEATVAEVLLDGARSAAMGPVRTSSWCWTSAPCYAEGGGQLADGGRIELGAAVVEVPRRAEPGARPHRPRATVVLGEVTLGDAAHAEVDIARRRSISGRIRRPTWCARRFREALGGGHSGRLGDAPGRFRFDFTAQAAVPRGRLRDIEARVDAVLLDDLPVHADVMTRDRPSTSAPWRFSAREVQRPGAGSISVGCDWPASCVGGTCTPTHPARRRRALGEASMGSGVRSRRGARRRRRVTFLAREHAIVGQLTRASQGPPESRRRVSAVLARLRGAGGDRPPPAGQQALAVAPGWSAGPRRRPVRLVTHDAGRGRGRGTAHPGAGRAGGAPGRRRAGRRRHDRGVRAEPVVVVATRRAARGRRGQGRPAGRGPAPGPRRRWRGRGRTSPRAGAPTPPPDGRGARSRRDDASGAGLSHGMPGQRVRVRRGVDVGAAGGRSRWRSDGVLGQPPWRPARDDSPDRADQHEVARLCPAGHTAYLVVGFALSMSGAEGAAARRARAYAREMAALVAPVRVRFGGRTTHHGGVASAVAGSGGTGTRAAGRGGPGGRRPDPAVGARCRACHRSGARSLGRRQRRRPGRRDAGDDDGRTLRRPSSSTSPRSIPPRVATTAASARSRRAPLPRAHRDPRPGRRRGAVRR